jgi:IS30 family transposase
MASWQKPHIERGHEYIRMVLPKGTSFDSFDQSDITKLSNHINSYYRDTLRGRTPYQAAKAFLGPKVTRMLDLKKIPPDEVHLKPTLLR